MAGFFDDTENTTSPVGKSFFDDTEADVPERTAGSTLKDVGISLAKGVVGAGQGIVGLADIPTGGRIGKGLESIGIKPVEWQKDLSEELSPAQQAANRKVDQAKGFLATAGAMIENPSTIAHGIVETLPSVAAGGVLGRGALAVGSRLAPKAVTSLGKTGSAIAASSVGEGAISAGQTAEEIRNQTDNKLLTPEQSALAAASGVGTAAFSVVGGSLAKKLGFADVDTMIVSGLNPAKKEGFKGVVKSIIGGGITEGVFEELPQTIQETIFTNAALDKNLLDGVPEGAAKAIILGGVMGGGANLLPGTQVGPVKTDAEIELERRAGNILDQKDEQINQSIQKLSADINSNKELLADVNKFEAKVRELNIAPKELIAKIVNDDKNNRALIDKVNSGLKSKEELTKKQAKESYDRLSPEEKAIKDVENKFNAQRETEAQEINVAIKGIDQRIEKATNEYNKKPSLERPQDPEKQKELATSIIELRKEKDKLLDRQKEVVERKTFAPYTTQAERQKSLEETFGTANRTFPADKDAGESGTVFQEELSSKNISDYVSYINNAKATERQQVLDELEAKIIAEPSVQKRNEYADYIKNNLADIVKQEEAAKAQQAGETFYTKLFREEKRPFNIDAYNEVTNKSAEESAKAFEAAGMGAGQTGAFTNERQVPLTDQQQILVDKNNFQISKLKEQYNTTIDRDQRVNLLNQIDVLEKDNAGIRTSVEQFEELGTTGDQTGTKQETFLGDVLTQVKEAEGLTGQLANFISDFITKSKLNIKVVIDPTVKSANYVGGKVNTITLRDPAQLLSSIHEITHAVTVRELQNNKAIRDQVKLLMERVKLKAIKEGIITPAQVELLGTAKTSKEYKDNLLGSIKYENVAYGLLNEYEFLAQAMGNSQFQSLLKATTIADKGVLRNAWDAFIEVVMKTLGIKGTSKNAFGEALGIIAKLASQENVNGNNNLTISEELGITEQKISDDTYTNMFKERNSLVRTIGQTLRMRGHEIKQLIDKGLGSISTRLKNVDPMLSAEIRNLDFRTAQKIVTALRIAHPLLEKTKAMSPEDKFVWDAARRNSDEVKIKQMAEKYGMTADQEKLRDVLNVIRQEAIDVGYDVGFIEEYWPRIIKDQEGFLQATKGISQRPVITDAIKRHADKLGMSVERFELEFPEQAADIASNTILGRNLGIGGPGNIQARQYETVPPELNKFYMDSDAALMQYIYSMTKKIEARKFFGKVPERIAKLKAEKKRKSGMLAEYQRTNNAARVDELSGDLMLIEQQLDKYKLQRDYTENIGTYINELRMDGRIQADDEKVVRDILDARFHEHGTTGIVNAYKNMAYIDVMGSPLSALTQIGDLAWAMYVGKVWTPRGLASTVKNIGKAITKKSEITKEDLGIERIAQEFADGTTLGNAVSWVFKKVQLERIDSIGKETLINNAFDNYKSMASTEAGRTNLLKQIKPIFGTQSDSVINDLLAGNPTDNVKMLLYHRLLDFQPVALSEMSEQYLKSGNGRVFYMLKTYTLKQFDVFRNEAWHKIKTGERDQVIEGIGNMIKLVSLLTLANAGADELKDLLLGKDTKFEDHVIENFLTMGGASKYVRMQTTREGLGSGMAGQILPPFRFINSISKDLNQAYGDYIAGDTINFDHARIVESIPIAGKLYYWNYGRGEDYKKSSNEQEFGAVGKDVDLFKKQLENATDKRTFLNSNLDKFKQMKLHENFQKSLNRNQAVVNKLKEIEQTTNVRERLGQLKNQREVILKKYFEVAKMMQ